ncbi:MAG TPA: hypothetical protein IAC79_05915 [Candidatus Spyradenecus faecavium]|uniref:ABC-type transport auxiliary lipoprotein component domain-containing protein n=1 Tax=Candidatus Spyradenecus faecavium TaxID=2840947 RepID=A0A9D1T3T7_9BACT|nr:hypothetical protein [Candidatus Spyradenecus faecavium]
MNRLLPALLPAALLLAGCFGGAAPQRHYTVLDPAAGVVAPAALDLDVRMAPDLRAASAPTLYRADGSVSTYPGLTYYAPLELAIPRALRELGPEALGLKPGDRLDLDVLDFCVDRRTPDGVPVARVTLSADGRAPVTVAKPLPAGATPLQTRALLASALLEAIRDARK